MTKNLKIINLADVEVEEVEWLWYPYIPYGKVTKIEGDAGQGKTTLVLQLIGLLTRGAPMFGEDEEEDEILRDMYDITTHPPISVIYQTAEDGLSDTIKPRLLAAGAECSRVLVIDDGDDPLTFLDERLEGALQSTGARLVVLDPIQGFLGAKVDMNRANEVRPIMKHLMNLANKYKCAIVLVGHTGKNFLGKSAVNQGLGSADFSAAPRSVLYVGRLRNDPETRVICHTKSSLAPEGKPAAFKLGKDKGFEWIGEIDVDVAEILAGSAASDASPTKQEQAEQFLREILADGAKPQSEVVAKAKELGIGERTLGKAKRFAGIISFQKDKKWFWSIQTVAASC